MERVGGISLAELLRLEHPLKIERAVRLAGRIAGALGAVHMFGVVHGDIRPSNIIIGNDETTIKLVGFERARLQDVAPVALLERSGVLEAHFEYRSPEQIRDEEVTSLADVYGLGVLFYEMLTGRLPFSASTASALKIMHLSNPPWPLRELISDIPQMVEDKVLQALEKDPERRQNHIQDVANEYLYEKALYYEGARNGATGAEDGDPARTDAEEDLETVRPRRWGRDAVFAGLAILITIGGLWALGWLIDSEVSEYTPPRQELSLPPAPFSPVPPPVAAAPSAPEASSTAVQAGPKPTQESKETRPLGAPAQLRTSNAKTARKNLRAVPAPTSSPSDSRTPSAESAVGQPGADSQADPGAVIDWLLKKPLGGS
jgi:serine/threonine-protein kinase